MTKVQNLRRKLLAALLIAAVALAFSPLAATTAHAASGTKFTLYKGQKIPVSISVLGSSAKVKFTSSKSKVVQIKTKKKNSFTIIAKKAGKATLTAKAKNAKTKKWTVTVKGSYPAGSEKKPVALGSSWNTIKSQNGKKQIKAKTTVWTGEAARSQLLALENEPADGTAYFDRNYYNDPEFATNRTFYLLQIDYNIVKGYPSGDKAYLYGLLGGSYYNANWKQLSYGTDYRTYTVSGVPYDSDYVTNGATGTYYVAIFLNNSVKELRCDWVGRIRDYQSLGTFFGSGNLVTAGCVSQKLP